MSIKYPLHAGLIEVRYSSFVFYASSKKNKKIREEPISNMYVCKDLRIKYL